MATTTERPNNFVMRLIGAAALDTAIYEEVEADRTATGQALLVVLLSSLAAGIGARGLGGGSVQSIVFISVVALMAWAAWALVTFEIGARLMPEPQTRGDVSELRAGWRGKPCHEDRYHRGRVKRWAFHKLTSPSLQGALSVRGTHTDRNGPCL